MSQNYRGNRYYNNQDRNRDYYRSRDKDQSWKKDKNQQYNQHQNNRGDRDNNQRSYNNKNYRNNYGNKPWSRSDFTNQQSKIRQIVRCVVPRPVCFVLCQNPQFYNKQQSKFEVQVRPTSDNLPPVKPITRADELKSKITPIQKIWTSTIKQYLNDSQFVQIYRKGKSLAYGNVQYGKTIINYDEGDKSMHYENQSSQSKIFSRAYFKIWEILDSMKVFQGKEQESLKIGSVAQGPGGFIHALIDYRLKNSIKIDKYYAITLRIGQKTRNAKDWSDYRGKQHFDQMRSIGYKIKLSYGQTGNGDLLKQQNIDYFASHDLQGQKCFLVTGDGGIQCIGDKQFDYQQIFNAKLFLGQIITALKIQQIGGKFILKIYDFSFQLTKQLITLLTVFYKKVQIVKPVTSRPGNSQKYLLAQNFIGLSQNEEKNIKQLLKQWTQKQPNLSYFQNKQFVDSVLQFKNFKNFEQVQKNLNQSNSFYLKQQIDKLEQGIKLAQDNQQDEQRIQQILQKRRFKEQMGYAHQWCKMYGIKSIAVTYQQNQQKINQSKIKQQ